MQHTKSFEIAIPKEFLRNDVSSVNTELYDFKFKVTVYYSCEANGNQMEIYHQSCSFIAAKHINWKMTLLERYFLEAAHNNWESEQAPEKQNDNSHVHPVFQDIFGTLGAVFNPRLSKPDQLGNIENISQQGLQC